MRDSPLFSFRPCLPPVSPTVDSCLDSEALVPSRADYKHLRQIVDFVLLEKWLA
uniref:Uncharacterized protein n=1 Tax=Magallana gigas TaxID=29159 RepID=K1RAK6_MAGGI